MVKKPEVSILLPSVRGHAMLHCITSIINNTYDVDYEIVVIGDVQPPDFIKAKIRWIDEEERQGVVTALMLGYDFSHGDFVIPMSDDARVCENWLKPTLDEVKKDEKNIGDFVVFPHNPFSYWGIKFSPFCLISKARCEQIGGFMDKRFKSFYGDPDLSLRNHMAGGKLVTGVGSQINHPANNDLVHQTIVNKYVKADRQLFCDKWEPIFGPFPGDP